MGAFLGLLNPISTILERVLPDKAQQDAAKANLAQLALQGQLEETLGQLQINAIEAQKTAFTWREGIGWVCVTGLFSQFLIRPMWCAITHRPDAYPSLDIQTLATILFAMLGIGVTHPDIISAVSSKISGNGH